MRYVLLGFATLALWSQTAEEGTRQVWVKFQEQRPEAKKKTPARKIAYRPIAAVATRPGGPEMILGVTLWRMRRPAASDAPGTRLLVLEPDQSSGAELVPERVSADATLASGDRVRLTIEVPRTGYLYVVDREQYADNSVSAPYLIYPNHLTRAGDNAVAAGRLVEIPDRRDKPNVFHIRPRRADQVSEVLSVLVTNEPIPNLKIGKEPLRLSEEQYREWEKNWGVQPERFEMVNGEGKALTPAEKSAGDGGQLLSSGDAMPQTLYKVPAAPGQPILMNIPLRIGK